LGAGAGVAVVVAAGAGAVGVDRVTGAAEVAVVRGAGTARVVGAAVEGCVDGRVDTVDGTGVVGTAVVGTADDGAGVDGAGVDGTTTGATGDDGLLLGAGAAQPLCCAADALAASCVPGSWPPPIAAVSATEPTEQDSARGAQSRRHPCSRAGEGRERKGTGEVLTADHESLPSEGNRVRSVTGVSCGEHPGGASELISGIGALPQPLPWSTTGHSRRGPHLGGARRS
jgi:hypothetical protein